MPTADYTDLVTEIELAPSKTAGKIVVLPGLWQMFAPPDIDFETARQMFEAKHGRPMRELHQVGPVAFAGPIEDES